MTHFYTLAVLPGDTPLDEAAITARLTELLAPYDENTQVALYKRYEDFAYLRTHYAEAIPPRAADGVGLLARPAYEGRPALVAADCTPAELAAALNAYYDTPPSVPPVEDEDGDAHYADAYYADDQGLYTWSTYNSKSKWDWWVVGGRWGGVLCARAGWEMHEHTDTFMEGCARCGAQADVPPVHTDLCVRFTSHADQWYGDDSPQGLGHNIRRIRDLSGDYLPRAVVTPEGWLERGRAGWFGFFSGDEDWHTWRGRVGETLSAYADGFAVVLDLHI